MSRRDEEVMCANPFVTPEPPPQKKTEDGLYVFFGLHSLNFSKT